MKPRVVHIITKLELGGAQRNTLYTVEHLDPSRWDKVLVCGEGGVLDEEAKAGRTFRTVFLPSLVRELRPLKDVAALWSLWRTLRRIRPDLVHTHSSKAGILGRLAARAAGTPVVIHTVHGFSFSPFHTPLRRTLYRWAERMAAPITTRFLVVSRANLEEGVRLGLWKRDGVDLVRSGISIRKYRDATSDPERLRAELRLPEDAAVVGSVGNFKPQKGPMELLETFARVARQAPRAHLVVAGDGPLREAFEGEARRRGLDDRVRVLGWRRDIPGLLRLFDLFLLTSL
jgi:glycosyltransferase involved in cell wall biosynthesis